MMKINPTAAFQAYNKMTEHSRSPHLVELPTEESMQRGSHTDQIQISPEGARKMEIDQLTKAIVSETKTPASSERLEKLRTAVRNGTYHIPTGDLADAVMRHLFIA